MLRRHGRHDEALAWRKRDRVRSARSVTTIWSEFCIHEHLRRATPDLVEVAGRWQRFGAQAR